MKPTQRLRGAATLALLVAAPVAATATIASLATAPKALAADHLDSPSVTADAAADITDVYSFMKGTNVVLVLNVTPLANSNSKFSDKTQYVFHTESTDAFGTAGMQKDIIAEFDADQTIHLWVGTQYLTGNASATTGLSSADGKIKVFAGLRDDPFFFNLDGFLDVVKTIDDVEQPGAPDFVFDAAGCPTVDAATSAVLVNKLKTDPKSTPPGGVAKDFFAGLNVLSIVVEVDKTLLNSGGPLLAVWGSTNKGL